MEFFNFLNLMWLIMYIYIYASSIGSIYLA